MCTKCDTDRHGIDEGLKGKVEKREMKGALVKAAAFGGAVAWLLGKHVRPCDFKISHRNRL